MTSTTLTFPTPSSLGSLDHYIQAVNRFPLLTQEQETSLGRALKETEDLDAARQLVLSHLRLVVAVSRNYLGYGLPQADLIQEGNVGLMKAVRRFDPERGVRLVSFALHWIRAEMHEYILRNWRLVKVATTKAQRKLFFNLRSMKASSAALSRRRGDEDREATWASSRRKSSRWKRASAGTTWRSTRRRATRRTSSRRSRTSRTARTSRRRSSSARRRRRTAPRACSPRSRSSTTGAAASSRRAGCARTSRRDVAGPGQRVRRVRRADPPDREQGDEDDEALDGGAA